MRTVFIALVAMRLFRLALSRLIGYMDPGSGSLLLKILLGGVAGIAVMLRLFWYRIASIFRLGKSDTDSQARTDNS